MKPTLKTLSISAMALCVSMAAAPALLAQDFDFKSLDKLSANATSSTNLTLSAATLQLAAGFLGNDNDKDAAAIKNLVNNLKGIYIRAYEFDKPNEYSESDLAPLRALLKPPKWTTILDVRDHKDWTQVFFAEAENNKLEGVAVVSTEPTSLTVVYIDGELNRSDLEKLSGNMGIPDLKGLTGGKLADPKADNKTDKKSGK